MTNPTNQDPLKILMKKIAGIVLIILGILGLFLPFTPGIAMIIIGVILFGNHKLIMFIQKIKGKIIKTVKK